MMEIFFETKDVFQLKDIEKIAPKTKGIAPMTVKDVLQSLVDDNMVDCERVGTSNYFWAFPSKALHARELRLEELQKQVSEAQERKSSLQNAVGKAKEGREDTTERSALLKELQALKDEQIQLHTELDKYKECDPEVVEQMKKSNAVAKEAVSRWTGATYTLERLILRKIRYIIFLKIISIYISLKTYRTVCQRFGFKVIFIPTIEKTSEVHFPS
ncbi:meiotic nuclear division protein 1 homolog isoform X2 [Nerophis ophidion]|nr:meiotic nuclear division protein 1 homolog isoform X2 [Nerophis ophidion]